MTIAAVKAPYKTQCNDFYYFIYTLSKRCYRIHIIGVVIVIIDFFIFFMLAVTEFLLRILGIHAVTFDTHDPNDYHFFYCV